jgi:hypothetical protein
MPAAIVGGSVTTGLDGDKGSPAAGRWIDRSVWLAPARSASGPGLPSGRCWPAARSAFRTILTGHTVAEPAGRPSPALVEAPASWARPAWPVDACPEHFREGSLGPFILRVRVQVVRPAGSHDHGAVHEQQRVGDLTSITSSTSATALVPVHWSARPAAGAWAPWRARAIAS